MTIERLHPSEGWIYLVFRMHENQLDGVLAFEANLYQCVFEQLLEIFT